MLILTPFLGSMSKGVASHQALKFRIDIFMERESDRATVISVISMVVHKDGLDYHRV